MRATFWTTFTRGPVPTSTTVHAPACLDERLRSHPSNLIRVMPAKGAMDDHTTSWGIEPVPERLRVLGLVDQALLWGSLGVSLLVIVVGALLVPALSLRDALLAIAARRADRQRDARERGTDRCGRARSRDGADARAARPRRLVRADGAEHAPVLGLGDVRADHHRGRRSRALRRADRRGRTVVLDARLRRGCRFARADGACLRRAPLHPPLRGVRRARVARVPDLVVALRGRPLEALARGARGRPHALDRDGPRDRDHRFVGAADPRLHALLARPSARRGGAPGSATSWRRPGCSCSACCSC